MRPTGFQIKMWWAALTAFSIVSLVGVVVGTGWLVVMGIGSLSAILTPLAVAGILAYLLDPVVTWLTRRGLSRGWAVLSVFLVLALAISLISLWIVPSIHRQGSRFVKGLPTYSERAQRLVETTIKWTKEWQAVDPAAAEEADPITQSVQQLSGQGIQWLQEQTPTIAGKILDFLKRSIGGALGIFGFLLSLVLVPIFLFFFLKDGPEITASWSNYLPLRASPLKSEVVSLLNEINGYLISFFRGQLLVSLIDGALIAVALLVMGMDFAILIGLMVGVLGLIPYAGVIISWVPAVLIAVAQWGDWIHPLIVTVIFLVVNNLDGLLIAPHIVGESVGLHPLTVIISVLAWSLILGGLLGALLAVPLTATLKVLLKRYFWDRPAKSVETATPSPPG
jgi:predicted PurR-regulated permease PerM